MEEKKYKDELLTHIKFLMNYLKEKHHPHTVIEITMDGVKIKETIESIPIEL
jgi:hypothetical protein